MTLHSDLRREYLRRRIDHHGIYRVAPGAQRLLGKAPGTYYTWQFYLRRCLYDPVFVTAAAQCLVEQLPTTQVQFAGVEDAGVVLAAALGAATGTPWLTVKKQRKVYGLHNWTEGTPTGLPIVLVDDLAGSQRSLKTAAQTCTALGLQLADFYVTLVNKTANGHSSSYLENTRLISLFTCADFAMTWQDYTAAYGQPPEFGRVC